MSRNSTIFSHAILTCASGWAIGSVGSWNNDWKWCHTSFALIFVNSAIGIVRYASSSSGDIERAYNLSLFLRSCATLPCLACHFYFMYGMKQEFAYLHVASAAVPIVLRLLNSRDYMQFVDPIMLGNVLSMAYICIVNENYYGLNVALTFAFAHFIVKDQYTYLDFPAIDFYNYLMCFFCVFAVKSILA